MSRRWPILLALTLAVGGAGAWWTVRSQVWTWQAERAMRAGRWNDAWDLSQKLLARDSEDGLAHMAMAGALSARGEFHVALTQLRLVAGDSSWASRAARREGEILLLLDRASEAETALRRCVDLCPRDSEDSIVSRILLVKIYRWLGRQFDAMSLLEYLYRDGETSGDVATRVASLVQMFLVEYGEHDPKARATMLRRFVANDPQYVAARVALAQQEFPNGDLGSALQELQLCLQASPQDVECRQYLLEYGLHVAGAEPRSLEPLLDGWPAERRGFQYYRLLGELRLRQERLDDAISAFRDANKIRPDQIGVRHQHGMALMRQGRETEANQELRRTEELRRALDYERVKRLFDGIPKHIEMGRVGSADAPMLRRLGSFYEEIGRRDLTQRWLREADRLKSGHR